MIVDVKRLDWDTTWMRIADVMAQRSACVRAQVGAVIVDPNNRCVASAYNGPPSGYVIASSHANCRAYCPRAYAELPAEGYVDCVSAHAEMNAVAFVDRRECEGGTIYVTGTVCYSCAKTLANCGLYRVVMRGGDLHRDPERTTSFLRDCGLMVDLWGDE